MDRIAEKNEVINHPVKMDRLGIKCVRARVIPIRKGVQRLVHALVCARAVAWESL